MKKLLAIILAVGMLLFLTAKSVQADASYVREPGYTVKIQSVAPAGPGATAHQLSSVITAGNRVLGFTYTDSAAGTIGIWDAATTATAGATNRIGEVSVAAGGTGTCIFPFPKQITLGLVYSSTTATGNVTIYYE